MKRVINNKIISFYEKSATKVFRRLLEYLEGDQQWQSFVASLKM